MTDRTTKIASPIGRDAWSKLRCAFSPVLMHTIASAVLLISLVLIFVGLNLAVHQVAKLHPTTTGSDEGPILDSLDRMLTIIRWLMAGAFTLYIVTSLTSLARMTYLLFIRSDALAFNGDHERSTDRHDATGKSEAEQIGEEERQRLTKLVDEIAAKRFPSLAGK